jgi:hypothetical protein
MSDRCKLDLGNERFVRACEWKGEVRIDIREFQNGAPTKKDISLPLGRWKILTNDIIGIDEALEKRLEGSLHLGGHVYCKVTENNVCVDIRQYWGPPDQDGIVPTKKGICLRPAEYVKLKESMSSIGEVVPELFAVAPCYSPSTSATSRGL